MIKYSSNAFLATKISFINEIGNICKKIGADTLQVSRGIGMDHRISPHFLRPGIGFGGSCFPKDVKALMHQASDDYDYKPKILNAVMEVNDDQPLRLIELAEKKLGDLNGKTAAILGLAFKAGTDDLRESRAIPIIHKLIEKGVKVQGYDPKAGETAKEEFGDKITYAQNIQEALKDADFCLITTEWPEFKNINFDGMKGKAVFDGRNILENRADVDYEGLCW
jgi:UDPglucose 6-dehydrogenase